MLFTVDLDTLELITSATDRSRVTLVEGKRGDAAAFQVQFVRSGVAEELAGSSVLTFGAKENGKYDDTTVVVEDGFTLTGSGTTAKYVASPSFATTALDALFLIDGNDANDPASVDLMAEFTWRVGSGSPTSCRTFIFRVHNDVNRDEDVTPTPLPTPVGTTAPVNGVTAAVTLDPTGADNSITFTAVTSGADANDITVAIATPAVQATTDVAVVAEAITVTPGTKARMIVTGTLSPDVTGELIYAGGGASSFDAVWTTDGELSPSLSGQWAKLFFSFGNWTIHVWNDGVFVEDSSFVGPYSGEGEYEWPDEGTPWDVAGIVFTGVATVTAGTTSAQQVIDAVNADVTAAALVTASASGTVTGAVAAVTATNLSGGVAGTLAPPYVRVDSGFLYIQDSAGTWKKTALSAL